MTGRDRRDHEVTTKDFVQMRQRFIDPEQTGRDELRDNRPRDCVVSYPTVTPDTAHLVALDCDGNARAELILPADIVTASDGEWLLAKVRASSPRRDRSPNLHLLIG